ncbi:hypothetical protein ACFL0U_04280, partial [Pseudomonadota bacterium]
LKEIKEKIAFLVERGVYISLNFVYHKNNSNDLKNVLNYASKHNLDVKILELIEDKYNESLYEDIFKSRGIVLEHKKDLIKTELLSNTNEIFTFNNNTIKIIYSYIVP